MINIRNILSVARYERKILFRSWFFRIFSILGLFILFSMNMGVFGFHGGIRWTHRAIAANLPYINVLIINVAQAIIAVFLAADFLRRDKKLDTTEVIYTRPISNGEYVVGKTAGILVLFLGLVVMALAMSLIFNLTRQDVPVVWETYLYYPLLITIPTLIFILGLSFLLMIIIRNQAVTFVILLGYIGLTLFYFQDKMHGLLDYMAFNLPMVYSDFIGFADPERIILHRSAYFLMGVGFIFATIRFLNRLPQVGRWNWINVAAFIIFISAGGFAGLRYYSAYAGEDAGRDAFLALNNRYALSPAPDIMANDLDVIQTDGRKLEITSKLRIRNDHRRVLDTLIFSLNPGFGVAYVVSGDTRLEYTREQQIIKIVPSKPLEPGMRMELSMSYSGIPDESIAYLDVPDNVRAQVKRIMVAPLDKKPCIAKGDYYLLTPELLWYPVSGVRFNEKTFMPGEQDFTRYTLRVKPSNGLTPVAPGRNEEPEENVFLFIPEHDLNALSLAIGPFEKRSITLEGVEYNLYLKPNHDFFSGFFENITDTIPILIKEAKDNYEIEDLDLYYPFNRINLVEVPVQFHAYERPQVETFETIQPEMILLPEKGAGLSTLDFARYRFFEEQRNRRQNETSTPEEIELRLFQRFITSTFFMNMTQTRPVADRRQGGGEPLINYDGVDYENNPFGVFPLYYSYMTGISSTEYPLFNSMLEIYLKEGFSVPMRQAMTGGMSEIEKANMALRDHSINEIFSDWDNTVTSSLISQAGSFVFMALKNRVGLAEFDNFLYYYLEDHAFSEITFEQFSGDFYREFDVVVEPYFETLNTRGRMPSFLMSDPDYILTRDEIGEVYLVRFSMRNNGDARGIVNITFRLGGSFGPGGGGMNEEQRIYELEPGITKDIQVTLFEQPRVMTVNTLISGNIPSTFTVFLRSAEEVRSTNMEEYERISDRTLTLEVPGEFVVDNEDPGFEVYFESHESKLKQYIDSRKEISNELIYSSLEPFHTPVRWTPVAHSGFYGTSIRSAMVARQGAGNNTATWTTVLPSAGFYDIYVYIPRSAMFGPPQRGRRGGQGGTEQGGGGASGGTQGGMGMGMARFADERSVYNYIISSNEGIDEVEFRLSNVEDGWNRLGAFHFPADTARIVLTNRTNGQRVIADAVKWIQR